MLDGLGAIGEGLHSEREFIFADSLQERARLLAALIQIGDMHSALSCIKKKEIYLAARASAAGTGERSETKSKRLRREMSDEYFNLPFDFASAQGGRNKKVFLYILLLVSLMAACAPTTLPTPPTQIVNVYATPATQPWLADVFACAPRGTAISVINTPTDADISLRLGEPELLVKPAYQIDTEEIVVVMNNARPLSELSMEQVEECLQVRY